MTNCRSTSSVINTIYILLLLSAFNISCSKTGTKTAGVKIGAPAFSHDSERPFFDFCDQSATCNLVMYSIKDKALTLVVPSDPNYRFTSPGLGPDGNHLSAMVVARQIEPRFHPEIVLIDLQQENFRKLTQDGSSKYGPNSSYDGKRMTYVQSHRERTWFNRGSALKHHKDPVMPMAVEVGGV